MRAKRQNSKFENRHSELRRARLSPGAGGRAALRIVAAAAVALGEAMCGAPAARAQQTPVPRIVNARMERRAAAGGLAAELRAFAAGQADPAWIGYAVPASEDSGKSCCWESWGDHERRGCGRCALESEKSTTINGTRTGEEQGESPVRLEGLEQLIVLLRAADHRIGEVRWFSSDCEIDAGGLRVEWLTGVTAAESVAALAPLVAGADFDMRDSRRVAEGALAAIAMHGDAAADWAFESFTQPSQPEKLRSQSAFWLGNSRGAEGLKVLERMARADPSDHVRNQVAFAYSVSREKGAVDDLIRMAQEDGSARVRGQALFWLAHKAGNRAAGTITDAIENDPDTETKRAAVFALTQMPQDEGVPLLIQAAKTNKNPAVRRQAFFWLGQSHDPRALAFFEEVLGR